MIASLRTEGEFKSTLCNTVTELPVILDQIKQKSLNDEFIGQTETKICKKKTNRLQIFSPNATQCCYILTNSSFLQNYNRKSWKIIMLATQGLQGWKVMCTDRTWIKISKTSKNHVKAVPWQVSHPQSNIVRQIWGSWLSSVRKWDTIYDRRL